MYAVAPTMAGDVHGIRRHVTLQSRRITNVTPGNLEKSVNDFLLGKWREYSQKFIYATSSSTMSANILDKVEELAKELDQQSIAFEVWDQERISEMLKGCPELVHDFFGRPWVAAFCGEEAVKQMVNRLDASDIAKLREELARIYAKTFGLADPGFAGFKLNDIRRVDLLERFVTPDLVSAAYQTATYPYSVAIETVADGPAHASISRLGPNEEWTERLPDERNWSVASPYRAALSSPASVAVERRPADQWLGTEQFQVIIGDPGAGKSALLRYLVLDLLRDEPQWKTVAEHWGEYLPVWLPFHFLAQRVVGQTGEPASVGPAIKAWLEQNESAQIWPLVEKALADHRLLLVVDGLDEWTSNDAGHYAAKAVERFASIRGIPVVASTRPYGLSRLTLDAGWVYSRIAPFTYDQQLILASHYFRAADGFVDSIGSAEIIDRTVDEFLNQVHRVPELSAFSGTPLFLILLVMLRLSSSSSLPPQRFDVYERALRLLVEDLPLRRRNAADVTTTPQGLAQQDLQVVLGRVSYMNQLCGNVSMLEEDALRENFIDALQDPSHLSMNRETAVNTANQLLDVAEGELGLLVRIGPKQLGFIHRVMQEQLAADYIASRLEFSDVQDLFEKFVGVPAWAEVLLSTFRKTSRSSERSTLLAKIRDRIGDTPAGLRARELLAEITFGAYGLPRDDVEANALDIATAIETHPYGPHRARLLDAVLDGMSGTLTENIARECLERWTLLVQEPSRTLVAQIARIPPDTGLSEKVCRLLVFAIRNADKYDAFDNASTIVVRCSTIGTDEERSYLRAALLNVLANPSSGLGQAAALASLALGWRDDPEVAAILEEARGHPDDQVRLVAVCDSLNVLADVFPDIGDLSRPATQTLTATEREWLLEHLWIQETPEVHFGMLVAAISAAVMDDQSVLADLLELLSSGDVPYSGSELTRTVMLTAFASNQSVADWVCDQIGGGGQYGRQGWIMIGDIDPLPMVYQKGSPHNLRVAESIEHFVSTNNTGFMDRALFALASVDQGPLMRDALVKNLANSSVPHWAAAALVEHFPGDADALDQLRSIIMGDPERASMVVNAASSVLTPENLIPRLMEILRSLANSPASSGRRHDIVASALIRAVRESGPSDQLGKAYTIREAIELIPNILPWFYGNPRLELAAELYPAKGSLEVLNEIAQSDDRTIEVFLRVFRDDPKNLEPFLAEASKILCSLPAHLRFHICRTLAERGTEPEFVTKLTARWAEEKAGPNKSVASLAYHQALVKIELNMPDNEEVRNLALAHLEDQMSVRRIDHEYCRRAAWVGMSILEDWSPLLKRLGTIGNSAYLCVWLDDHFNGPDRILLQQIATSWEQLRNTLGDQLLALLSGPLERDGFDSVWNSLALVAAESPALERELEMELAANPKLRIEGGIFLWTIRGRTGRPEAVSDALIAFLHDSSYIDDGAVINLLAQPERIGLQSEQLQDVLEQAAQGGIEGLALELLAIIFPSNPMVHEAWQFYSELRESSGNRLTHRVNTRAYLALAYAVTASDAIVSQIQLHHGRLCKIGNPYIDRMFARYVSHRLRRDSTAAAEVRKAILNPDTPDSQAAVFVSLLRNAVGLDDELLAEIERRISHQTDRKLAVAVRDPHAGVSLPVRTIFVDAAEGARHERSD